jgi:hypothetical protein
MPAGVPPKGTPPFPQYVSLPAGSFLWRVVVRSPSPSLSGGPTESLFGQGATEPDVDGARWGGRFDPTADDPHPHCYAALDDLTALCEVLLRDVGFDAPLRYLPRQNVAGRTLVLLETLNPLWLVSLLEAADLAAARQDTWLIHAESADYARTRLWGQWLRGSAGPDRAGPPAGMMWPSKRQPTGRVVVFFGDRCEDAVVRSAFGERRLDDNAGLAWLNRRLSLLNTRVAPLASRRPAGHVKSVTAS